MKFSTIAGMIGGGVQVPGFMGVGVNYITSRKFLKGDGGIKRIVWMPKELKERIRESFQKRAQEEEIPELERSWQEDERWQGVSRLYRAEDVVKLRW